MRRGLNSSHAGFTLIEIMVAVSIFVVVAIVATGAFITANRVNQKAQAIKLVMDNLNFALDSMSLKIRKGGFFYCAGTAPNSFPLLGQSCPNGGSVLLFTSKHLDPDNPGGDQYFAYRLGDNGQIEYWSDSQSSAYSLPSDSQPWPVITSPEAVIEGFTFRVFNVGLGTTDRPRVVVSLYGHTTIAGQNSSFALETTASER